MDKKTNYQIRFVLSGVAGLLFLGTVFSGASPLPMKVSSTLSSQDGVEIKDAVKVQDSIWVAKPDGAESCAPDSGRSLTDGAKELKNAKIPVLDSKKGTDRKMHVQMCGAPKGTTNSFLIPKDKLSDAVVLGYQKVGTSH